MALPEQIENQSPADVACLMVPVTGRMLLMPSVSVAEMVPFTTVSSIDNTPDWLLGYVYWREQQVPLLSFEQINGEPRPDLHSQCRIAVLNNTGESDDLPFIAMMTQGIPRLARVTEEEIEHKGDGKAFEQMEVNIAGEKAFIPDIAALERAFLELNL